MPPITGPTPTEDRICRRPEVQRLTGLSRGTLTDLIDLGEFPRPLLIGRAGTGRARGWLLSEIRGWIAERAAARTLETRT